MKCVFSFIVVVMRLTKKISGLISQKHCYFKETIYQIHISPVFVLSLSGFISSPLDIFFTFIFLVQCQENISWYLCLLSLARVQITAALMLSAVHVFCGSSVKGQDLWIYSCLWTWASVALALDVSSTCCDKQISVSFILSFFLSHVLLSSFIFHLCSASQKKSICLLENHF